MEEDQEWVEMGEEGYEAEAVGDGQELSEASNQKAPVRVMNKRTGEIRTKSKEANMWDLSTDQDGHACFIHRRTKRVVYDNPKYEPLDQTASAEEVAKERNLCMEAVYYAAYFVSDFLEQHSRATTDKERKVLFRRLDESSAVKSLAGVLAKARGLWGTEFDQDEYLVYANELLARTQAMMLDKTEFVEKAQMARRKIMTVERASAVVVCHQCGHEVERTKKYCTTCGAKMLFYRMPGALSSSSTGVEVDDSSYGRTSPTEAPDDALGVG